MGVDQSNENFEHPLFDYMEKMPGADIGMTTADKILSWGSRNSPLRLSNGHVVLRHRVHGDNLRSL